MLLCSVKIKKHTVTLISLVCAAVFVLICFFSLKLAPADTVGINGQRYSLTVAEENDIKAFLSTAGYEVDELLLQREVVIPSEWNEVYSAYADMQKQQGFDLNQRKGKSATEYSYSLKDREDFAVVLVCGDRICAAHLSKLDGSNEMKPLINK